MDNLLYINVSALDEAYIVLGNELHVRTNLPHENTIDFVGFSNADLRRVCTM